jgi:transcription termination factor Rho
MTAEQQLERSVLEHKERDELHAIAHAMSLKTTSRARKADIIDQILAAAGVDAGSSSQNGASSNGGSPGGRTRTTSRRTRGAAATAPSDGAATLEVSTPHSAVEADGLGGSSDREDTTDGASRVSAASRGVAPDGAGSTSNGEVPLGGGEAVGTMTTDTSTTRSGNGSVGGPATNQRPGRHQTAEPGNRRGRRRRGRDRGGERELQGGVSQEAYQGEMVEVRGLLDLRDEGYGFLRCDGYLPSAKDVYVSISQARRFALRKGDYVEGASRPASNNEKYPALLRIDRVSGLDPEAARQRPKFESLTPLFPDQKLTLELPGDKDKDNVTARIVDLLAPIGKGQRGMIVSPSKAGKTTIMKQVAHSIEENNPEVHLMVVLVDERPEEVTDMRRSVQGEVVASTFDRPYDEHTTVAELAIERAKRLVELQQDVVIILDGITRLARAYNLAQPATGRIMSGGVDSGALYPPKRFFGAARNIEEGGSLTILATALVETGSKMDEVIFEEFKGTGNMELRLDRRLAERRLYPSIDVNASSTRHEELLFDRGELQQVWKLRRVLNALASDGNAAPGLELLMDKIRTTRSNKEFLADIAKGSTPG